MSPVVNLTMGTRGKELDLPYNYVPRAYQVEDLFRPLFPHHYTDLKILDTPRKKRLCLVWHRRAGKDKSLINAMALAAYEEVGNYLYLLPEQTQAKKVIWRGIDGSGFRFIDHIHPSLIKNTYSSELLIEMVNGSTIQFGGSDNYDSWMGTNPKGMVFSEFSLQDPMAWQYFRPILLENGGWAVFNYTARAKNHGWTLLQTAQKNPQTWHWSIKTIDDTEREPGVPVITREDYLQEIEEGMPQAIADQEFYCDFNAALFGSYYGELMTKAEKDGRIGFFPHDPGKLVHTAWDMGNDANVVWFIQKNGSGFNAIDYYEEPNVKFSEVCAAVVDRPYTYGVHLGPHDSGNRDPEHNTRLNTAADMGIDIERLPRTSRDDGIESVRQFLPRFNFNEVATERGLEALRSYERIYDDKMQRFRETPIHNWASHGSDAFRMFCVGWHDSMDSTSWTDSVYDVDTSWVE